MRKIYYVRVDRNDASKGLMQIDGKTFHEITEMNKTLPFEKRRFFATQILDTPGKSCKVLWETSYEISELLRNEDGVANYNEKNLHKTFTVVPLDEMADAEYSDSSACGSPTVNMDEPLIFEDRLNRLGEGLSKRKHRDSDMDTVIMYMEGERRHCVTELSKKYMVSTKTMYKYRRELNEYLRDFYERENCTI